MHKTDNNFVFGIPGLRVQAPVLNGIEDGRRRIERRHDGVHGAEMYLVNVRECQVARVKRHLDITKPVVGEVGRELLPLGDILLQKQKNTSVL
jgi:hypothetical protein